MTKVRDADHGFFSRGFALEKSALKDLIKFLEDHKENQTGHREVVKMLDHIPADKKKKYKDALDYLKSNYPNLTPPAEAQELRHRVFRVFDDLEFLKSPLESCTDCVIFGHAGQVPDDPRFGGTFHIPMGLTLHFYTIHGQSNRGNPTQILRRKPDDNEIVFNYETFQDKLPDPNRVRPKTKVRDIARVHPLTEVRTAKGTLARDKRDRLIIREGPQQLKLKEEQLTVESPQHNKVTNLLYDSKGLDRKKFGQAEECYNYVVKNGLGLHWETDHGTTAPYSAAHILAYQDTLKEQWDDLPDAEKANPVTLAQAWVPHFVYIHNDSVVRLSDLILPVYRFALFESAIHEPIKDFYFAGCCGIHPGWRPHTED
jgi:hypothetical protein